MLTAWSRSWESWREGRKQADSITFYCRRMYTHCGGQAVTNQLAGTTKRKGRTDLRKMRLIGTSERKSGPSKERTTSTQQKQISRTLSTRDSIKDSSLSTRVTMEGTITATNSSSSSSRNTRVDTSIRGMVSNRTTGDQRCNLGISISSLITTRLVTTTTTISNFSSSRTTRIIYQQEAAISELINWLNDAL